MTNGTGVFTLPPPTYVGSDASTGNVYTLPLVIMTGDGGSYGDLFVFPPLRFTGEGSAPLSIGTYKVPMVSMSGIGYAGILGSGIFNLPALQSNGGFGYRGSGIFVIPLIQFGQIIPLFGSGSIAIPGLVYGGEGTIIPISRVYRGIIANLFNQAISTYSNLPSNSLAYFQGRYLAANAQGIFAMDGGSDNGQSILSRLKTGSTDFGDNFIKYLRQVWLTYRSDGHLSITFFVGENDKNPTIGMTEIASSKIHEERIKAGRGLKGRFYTIDISNMSGADFDIDSLNLLVESIRRKIR